VLANLPKSQQPKAKRALQEIWMAETKADAEAAFDAFIESYRARYDKAAECLTKDRDALLTFYDFPAEHWKHLRTTNSIESTFATGRHRTIRSKGCRSSRTALTMVQARRGCAEMLATLIPFMLPRLNASARARPARPKSSASMSRSSPRTPAPPAGQFVLHAKALSGNPYDGHTLAAANFGVIKRELISDADPPSKP
jgi:Transposase, Mutator family